MYVGSGTSKLRHAVKTLRQRWDESEDDWRDRVREDFQDESLGDVVHSFDVAKVEQPIDQPVGLDFEACLEMAEVGRGQYAADDRAAAGVIGGIGLEQQARRAPGLALVEIDVADAGSGAEGLVVGDDGVDLGVAHCEVHIPAVEPNQRAGVTQSAVVGVGGENVVV